MSLKPYIIESGNWLIAITVLSAVGYTGYRVQHDHLQKINAEILKSLGIAFFGLAIYFMWFALSRHTSPETSQWAEWDLANRFIIIPIASTIFAYGMIDAYRRIEGQAKAIKYIMLGVFMVIAAAIGFY